MSIKVGQEVYLRVKVKAIVNPDSDQTHYVLSYCDGEIAAMPSDLLDKKSNMPDGSIVIPFQEKVDSVTIKYK